MQKSTSHSVIFDMDGVIINSEPLHMAAETKFFHSLGFRITEAEHHSFVGTTSINMWRRLKARYGLPQPIEELVVREREEYFQYLCSQEQLEPIAYIPELMDMLRSQSITLLLASSSPQKQIDYILHKLDLKKHFTVCVSGDEVAQGKPAPDIFLKAAALGGCAPHDCLVIEDSGNGIAAAKAAGIKCIAFYNPDSGNQDLSRADRVVSSIRDITWSILEELWHRA
jgi:HAD superfamily hydrolase (TIGR01509 family)